VDVRRGCRRELCLPSGCIGCLRLPLKSIKDSALSMCSRAKSTQVFEFPILNDQSSFSTEKEYRSSCMATQGTCEKPIHLQRSREMAECARVLEIATSTLLDRNPIKRRSEIGNPFKIVNDLHHYDEFCITVSARRQLP
jgi:hypothetical protein